MIINISLIIVFFCLSFVVLSRRIDMKWFAKLVMCFMMISIIGAGASLNSNCKYHEDLAWNLFFHAWLSCFALGRTGQIKGVGINENDQRWV